MANSESIEETASKVEIATKKVEQTTSKSAPATGRTPWDALVDIGAMLGPYTPWLIIVAGTLFGVYHFIGLKNTIDERVETAKQQAEEDARKA